MCTTLNLGGQPIQSMVELRVAGLEPIYHDGVVPPGPDRDCCLCIVDIDAMARRYGWTEIEHDDDPMERRFTAAKLSSNP